MNIKRRNILLFFGTRPEAIKMAPVAMALWKHASFKATVAVSAQHRDMLDDVLAHFGITPRYDLRVMTEGQSLFDVTGRVLKRFERVLETERPDLVLVHGDTTTTLAGTLAAYYKKIPVGHVEAGLRTGRKYQPFPEEINRKLTDSVADLHFAPTRESKQKLLKENISPASLFVTGNTVIDALLWTAARRSSKYQNPLLQRRLFAPDPQRQLVLVTAHRRENFGQPLKDVFQAILDISRRHPECLFVYPVHPNPNVRKTAERMLKGKPGILLTPPVGYGDLVKLMTSCRLVLTDSGGLQEEAPSLGKPVLVLRNVTERPEAVRFGTVRVVGTDRGRIVREISRLLKDPAHYKRMANAVNPYGDGHAARRTVQAISHFFGLSRARPNDFVPRHRKIR